MNANKTYWYSFRYNNREVPKLVPYTCPSWHWDPNRKYERHSTVLTVIIKRVAIMLTLVPQPASIFLEEMPPCFISVRWKLTFYRYYTRMLKRYTWGVPSPHPVGTLCYIYLIFLLFVATRTMKARAEHRNVQYMYARVGNTLCGFVNWLAWGQIKRVRKCILWYGTLKRPTSHERFIALIWDNK